MKKITCVLAYLLLLMPFSYAMNAADSDTHYKFYELAQQALDRAPVGFILTPSPKIWMLSGVAAALGDEPMQELEKTITDAHHTLAQLQTILDRQTSEETPANVEEMRVELGKSLLTMNQAFDALRPQLQSVASKKATPESLEYTEIVNAFDAFQKTVNDEVAGLLEPPAGSQR